MRIAVVNIDVGDVGLVIGEDLCQPVQHSGTVGDGGKDGVRTHACAECYTPSGRPRTLKRALYERTADGSRT